MTTEREYLGYAPEPAKTWEQALEQANAYFIEAAHHSANGDTAQAVTAGAMGVGLAAESLQLERQAADDRAAVEELENVETLDGQMLRRQPPVAEEEIRQAMDADPRLSRWDVLDGIGSTIRPVPAAVVDYVVPEQTISCNPYPTAVEILDGPSCCDRHRAVHQAATRSGGAL